MEETLTEYNVKQHYICNYTVTIYLKYVVK